ncbi:hypothetical protein FTO74_14350 [Granulicella sp. WH15]|uniref:hypothetical protein n=1 Tax=Granulicella sp. WH15 TaxID=2602070 RepID=UPI0013673B03|nr:hypothetical protein [Granulicella sp. WH15]QHN04413.1 hypothetical protein FTO74_14350 [Granulicella sp. WH15]
MTQLNIPGAAPGGAAPGSQSTDMRRKLGQAFIIGGSFFGGGSVIYALVELVRTNPDKGFELLEKWGPWYFLAMFALWVVYGISLRLLEVLSKLGDRFAGSMDRVADEQVKLAAAARDQADAMQRTADRDDRDQERMATLVDYAGQKSREAAEGLSSLSGIVTKMAAQVEELTKK